MRKNFFSMAVAVIAMAFMGSADAEAQLPDGNFGVGASIGAGSGDAQIYYALDEDMDLALTLGYTADTPIEGDSRNILNLGIQYRYLFLKPANTIDPYVAINFMYGTDSRLTDDYNSLSFGAAYGLQAELVKNVYLTAQIGLGFTTYSYPDGTSDATVETELNFGGSRLGAIIYLQD